MFHIDISSLTTSSKDKDTRKNLEHHCNILYQKLITDNILNHNRHVSACFSCEVENCHVIPFDQREIVECHSNGLIGNGFIEIPEKISGSFELNKEIFLIVEFENSSEIVKVLEIGEIVRIKRKEMGLYGEKLPIAIRQANDEDLEKYKNNLKEELSAHVTFQQKVEKYNLSMKLVDVHYQFDRKKLYFFYTADGRVDFRALAKDLAAEFKVRIELRQMGVRDEAKKIGGIGTCGREYCCSAFLNNFKRITTQLAIEQNLNSKLGKLSGPCGKLKCCLSFESKN